MERDIYDPTDIIKLRVYDALKSVIDPELDINIIDLGLVYTIDFLEGNNICIVMTLSSKGCPMGDIIMDDIESIINREFPEYKLTIKLTWEPKWSSEFITPSGRKKMNIY